MDYEFSTWRNRWVYPWDDGCWTEEATASNGKDLTMNWKHWLVILGAPALTAFVHAFTASGDLISGPALMQDAIAAVFAAIGVALPSPIQKE